MGIRTPTPGGFVVRVTGRAEVLEFPFAGWDDEIDSLVDGGQDAFVLLLHARLDELWSMSRDPAFDAVGWELLHHVVREVAAYLPRRPRLEAHGTDLVIYVGSRPASTEPVPILPGDLDDLARRLMADVQGAVALHLHQAWPLSPAGPVMHPWAVVHERTLRLGFRTADRTAGFELGPFPLAERASQHQ